MGAQYNLIWLVYLVNFLEVKFPVCFISFLSVMLMLYRENLPKGCFAQGNTELYSTVKYFEYSNK